jgi:hypothetical protein
MVGRRMAGDRCARATEGSLRRTGARDPERASAGAHAPHTSVFRRQPHKQTPTRSAGFHLLVFHPQPSLRAWVQEWSLPPPRPTHTHPPTPRPMHARTPTALQRALLPPSQRGAPQQACCDARKGCNAAARRVASAGTSSARTSNRRSRRSRTRSQSAPALATLARTAHGAARLRPAVVPFLGLRRKRLRLAQAQQALAPVRSAAHIHARAERAVPRLPSGGPFEDRSRTV